MTNKQLMDLEFDTPVNYAMFKNLLYKGKDERHVSMEDKLGDKKRVYIELFLKHGSVI